LRFCVSHRSYSKVPTPGPDPPPRTPVFEHARRAAERLSELNAAAQVLARAAPPCHAGQPDHPLWQRTCAYTDHGARSTKKHTSRTALLPGGPGGVATSQPGKRFVAPRNLPDQLIGCVALLPSALINLSFSSERTQGQLLSSWSKSGALNTKYPRHSLCVHQCGSRKQLRSE
jgi:hypothetical protein